MRNHRNGGESVLDGGAVLTRVSPTVVEVCAGGEDAPDVLGMAINDSIGEVLDDLAPKAQVSVTRIIKEPSLY